ncbi:hypothetical protein ACFX5K_06040 [Rickettsiales bacterium LUAb2]
MSLKGTEVDSKEIELETWPAFVDILSSTVVVLAFAFFILVIVQSISKITSSTTRESNNTGGSITTIQQSTVLSDKTSQFQKLSIVSPATLAKNQEPVVKSTSETEEDKIIYVPQNAKITDQEVKVTEPGQSQRQVLGEIPKFTDTRVMEVLKELIIVQQDVIAQQRKVIEQQDTQIRQSTREFQSLLSLITKNPEIEDVKQKITPRDDQAKFIQIDNEGQRVSGTSESPHGTSTYVLSPPSVASKDVTIDSADSGALAINFNDNAGYFNDENLKAIKESLKQHLVNYQAKGVVLTAKPSDFAISPIDSRRTAVDRLLLVRSVLMDLGVDKSLIKFATLNDNDNNEKEENYGWVHVTAGQ